jgi:hypothetical protein
MSDLREHASCAEGSCNSGTPALTFTHPEDVLHSIDLSPDRKREILAGWASDAHAVPNLPALRQLDSGAIVPLDAVLAALRSLDGPSGTRRTAYTAERRPRDLPGRWRRALRIGRRHDDDDPPPAPAGAWPPRVQLELRRRRDAAWAGAAA